MGEIPLDILDLNSFIGNVDHVRVAAMIVNDHVVT